MAKRLTRTQYVSKARQAHGDKFDYSRLVYTGLRGEVRVICPEHGEFTTDASTHLRSDCPDCSKASRDSAVSLDLTGFLERARGRHGDRYLYNEVKFNNTRTPIGVVCRVHGLFSVRPSNHLQGSQCPDCAKITRRRTLLKGGTRRTGLNLERFKKEARSVHGGKYDYRNSEIVDGRLVSIRCVTHGEFEQDMLTHLNGSGCKFCARAEQSSKRRMTLDVFLSRARQKHGDKYDYARVAMQGVHDLVKIGCPSHGWFECSPANHLRGVQCKQCVVESKMLSKPDFLRLARQVHGDRYLYDKVELRGNNVHVKIVCPEHGEFEQLPRSHCRQGSGCPDCNNVAFWSPRLLSERQRMAASATYVFAIYDVRTGEQYVKIGISNLIARRIDQISTQSGYSVTCIGCLPATMELAWDYEQHLHQTLKPIKSVPSRPFAGASECFTLEALSELDGVLGLGLDEGALRQFLQDGGFISSVALSHDV
ncbi:hypothetical protein ACP3V3_19620 [Vibrio sp. PNB22_3_1]